MKYACNDLRYVNLNRYVCAYTVYSSIHNARNNDYRKLK